MKTNTILVVESDSDDFELLMQAAQKCSIKNPIKQVTSGKELIQLLNSSEASPFLILCAVNLPSENGFAIRESLIADKQLKYKSVPFVFWSEIASEDQIQHAYDIPAQGFFFKPTNFDDLCDMLQNIVKY